MLWTSFNSLATYSIVCGDASLCTIFDSDSTVGHTFSKILNR